MKILILGGSPNRNGSTQILIESFSRGAREAGHAVTMLDVAHRNVHPCTGCIACGTPSMTKRSRFPQMAFELGKNLR